MIAILAWRNLWRNRNRSLIAMASVWCAVFLAIFTSSIQKGVYDQLITNVVGFYSGYIQVHRAGYEDEPILENGYTLDAALEKRCMSVQGVTALSPRIETFALASSGEKTKGCMVTGIAPEREELVTHLKSKLVSGRFLTDSSRAVLLAEGLAHRLSIGVGDSVILFGQGYFGTTAAGRFPVAGLLHFGSPDLNERVAFLPLACAQEWLDAPGLITALVVSPDDPSSFNQNATALRKALPDSLETKTWEDLMPGISEQIQTKTASSAIVIGVLYLLISFGIFATLLMMFAERRHEFGMLIALGMKKAQLAWVTVLESVMITLTGCAAGLLVSFPVVWWFHVHPIRITGKNAAVYEKFGFEPVFPTALSGAIFERQVLIVLCIGLLLSTYPLVKIFTLKPVEAMRS